MSEVFDPAGNAETILGTPVERAATIADKEAEWSTRRAVAAWIADFTTDVMALLDNLWDFLDAYSDRQFTGQNASPGAQWPQFPPDPDPTTLPQAIQWVNRKMIVVNAREQILRTQLSFVSYALTRVARLLRLILAVLAKQIVRDPTLVPPPDGR